MKPQTQTPPVQSPQETLRADYRPPDHLVDRVDLHFDLGEEFTTVRARMAIRRNPDADGGPAPLVLDGRKMELVSLTLDGKPLPEDRYHLEAETLTIPAVPDACVLETEGRIQPQENTELEGLYKSGGNFCTQCESQGFRRITWFPDRPDVMARYTATITADKQRYPVLLSNGNLVEQGDLPVGRHFAKWEDPWPKPSYLFALVAGDLGHLEDKFTTMSGREVTLRIFTEHENVPRCGHAMDCLKRAMKWDEEKFGREYDLDLFMIVAVNDFNFGAMENKGLNVFNSKYILADAESATDEDFERILGVVGHEYFHNWTGNRVTCRDWFQLSLKEGLTIFRDQSFSQDETSAAIRRIEEVDIMRGKQFSEDAGPMSHPVRPDSYLEINNFYTLTVYHKGAEVVRMYRTLLGEEGFRKGMDLYFERHDHQAVTCDDFRVAMEDANGADLAQFGLWYSQGGTPVVEARGEFDAGAGAYTLHLKQSCPPTPGQETKQPFLIPLAVGFVGLDGKPVDAAYDGTPTAQEDGTTVVPFTQAEQSFRFTGLAEAPVSSLFRGWSAPVRAKAERTNEDLALLWSADSDAFNRWDAGQQLGIRVLLELVADQQAGRELELSPVFLEAFGRNLEAGPADPALLAEALRLPSESVLAEEMPAADPRAVHEAREYARRRLAAACRPQLEALFAANDLHEAWRFDPAQSAQRRVKNVCLAYLCLDPAAGFRHKCVEQFELSGNMTDTMAALSILTHIDIPERAAALQAFHDRWKNDEVVMDKWFAIQAVSSLPGTLQAVKKLEKHPAFDEKNPNKVRSLVAAFGMMNSYRFHEPDGSGYAFLADWTLRLNAINPNVGARLAGTLSRWRKFTSPHKEAMKAQLERLAGEDLSKGIFEIVSKSLAN